MGLGAGTTAEVFLGMNVKKFVAGTKKGIVASKQMMEKLQAHQAKLRKVSMAAGVALGVQLLWLKKVTKAAATQEVAEKSLADAVLKHEGATMKNVDALKAQAAALQKTTRFGDENIIAAQALLATYGVIPEHMEAATRATLDFATATKRDLSTAALTVGKAVGAGFTGELSRYGIILDTSVIPKTEIATAVMEKMNGQFGGRAQQDAATYAGRVDQLNNAVGDLQEEIGFALMPTLRKLILGIMPIIERTSAWIEKNKKLVAIITGVGIGGAGLLLGLSSLGLLLIGLPALLAAITSPIGLVVVGLIAVGTAIAYIKSQQKELPGTLKDTSAAMLENANEIAATKKKLDEYNAAVEEAKKSGMGHAMSDELFVLQEKYESLVGWQAKLIEQRERLNRLEQEKQSIVGGLAGGIAEPDMPLPTALDEDGVATYEEQLAIIQDGLAAYRDGLTETADAAKETGDAIGTSLASGQSAALAGTSTFFTGMKGMYKQFEGDVGKTILGSTVTSLKSVIDAWKTTEIAKATMSAPLSFGATLAAIAPIVAAAEAGKALLSALMSFEMGGIVPATGLALVHKGEVVYNPRRNSPADLQQNLAAVGAGGMGGSVYAPANFYGPVNSEMDLENAGAAIGHSIRRTLAGGA